MDLLLIVNTCAPYLVSSWKTIYNCWFVLNDIRCCLFLWQRLVFIFLGGEKQVGLGVLLRDTWTQWVLARFEHTTFWLWVWYSNSLTTDGDFCHQGWDTEIAQKIKIVEIYRHDHSLESSWGSHSDGTIRFSFQQFWGDKCIFWTFLKKPQSLQARLFQGFIQWGGGGGIFPINLSFLEKKISDFENLIMLKFLFQITTFGCRRVR
jgi:hypothetical protein